VLKIYFSDISIQACSENTAWSVISLVYYGYRSWRGVDMTRNSLQKEEENIIFSIERGNILKMSGGKNLTQQREKIACMRI
jgi:hypothetical protein